MLRRVWCGICSPDLLLAENVSIEESKKITAKHNNDEHGGLFPLADLTPAGAASGAM